MRIAIIDSGIDKTHKKLINCEIDGISIVIENNEPKIDEDYFDELGHGTACASIIYKLVPDAKLVAVKIFFNEFQANEMILIEAIRWCINNSIDVINMSLGVCTNNPHSELKELCDLAYKKNIAIIAAANNNLNKECYPAFFNNVFSVAAGKVKNYKEFGCIKNHPVKYIAKGTIQRVAWKNGKDIIVSGSSYACAHFTGTLANYLKKNDSCDLKSLELSLNKNCNSKAVTIQLLDKNVTSPFIYKHDFDKLLEKLFKPQNKYRSIKKIAVFPISEKEISTFYKHTDQCVYNISNFIDFPRTFNDYTVGKEKKSSTSVLNKIDFSSFDTLVIGYFFEQMYEPNINLGYTLLWQSLKENKNIYLFDDRIIDQIKSHVLYKNYSGELYIDRIDDKMFEEVNTLNRLPECKIPVIAVVGTSNKQGKFTTQLRIKKLLEKEGYKVAFISTEPHGDFFGANYTFHYGYFGSVKINRENWGKYLRAIIKGISFYTKPDIILTGIQGGLAPMSFSNTPWGNETSSLDFLYGIQPDGLICSVNHDDPIKQILNVTKLSEIYTNSNTLFLTMTPCIRNNKKMDSSASFTFENILSENDKNERLEFYSEKLGSPVIDVLDENNDTFIVNSIQKFFS